MYLIRNRGKKDQKSLSEDEKKFYILSFLFEHYDSGDAYSVSKIAQEINRKKFEAIMKIRAESAREILEGYTKDDLVICEQKRNSRRVYRANTSRLNYLLSEIDSLGSGI